MIGRAAIANPWIFSKKDREEIAPTQVWELMSEHLERTLLFYGTEQGLVLFRKFAASYLSPYNLKIEVRKNLLTESDPEKFKQQLGKIFSNISSSKLSERTPNSE
jgi:tRNA-dihydrouridine synthase